MGKNGMMFLLTVVLALIAIAIVIIISENNKTVEEQRNFSSYNVRNISTKYIGNPERPEGWEGENDVIKTFHNIYEQRINLFEKVNTLINVTEDSICRLIAVTQDSIGYLELHPVSIYPISKTFNWSE